MVKLDGLSKGLANYDANTYNTGRYIKQKINMANPFIWNEKRAQFLSDFLAAEQRPQYTMNYAQLHGYLRAVASSPRLISASEWKPLVFNEELPDYQNRQELDEVESSLLALYQVQLASKIDTCEFPCSTQYHPQREHRQELEQWARGFMQGYSLSQQAWDDILRLNPQGIKKARLEPDEVEDQLEGILYVIATVADAELAVAQGTAKDDLPEVFASLEDTVVLYGQLGHALASVPAQAQAPINAEVKIGRNDPCPCGSGKKYKKCCL